MSILEDLDDEFPGDSSIIYAQGLLLRDFLGKGLEARDYFEKAYLSNKQHYLSAYNATMLARDEQEFWQWYKIYVTNHIDKDLEDIAEKIKNYLEAGKLFGEIYAVLSMEGFNESKYGLSASLSEIALHTGDLELKYEKDIRTIRFHSLRFLDEEQESARISNVKFPSAERFPPEERWALQEAVKELNIAVELDPYDPELLNYQSAWSYLLGDYEKSIEYADNAIKKCDRRNYHRPYHNKSMSLRALGRVEEARVLANEALCMAEAGGNDRDIAEVQDYIKTFDQKTQAVSDKSIETMSGLLIEEAKKFSEKELNQFVGTIEKQLSIMQISNYTLRNISPSSPTKEYVLAIAEMLSTFSPETVFCVFLKLCDQMKMDLSENLLIAALYIASKSGGIIRRNAARFIAISILAALKPEPMRLLYRQLILGTAAAATDEMASIDDIVRKELYNMNTYVALSITKQEPISKRESERAAETILSRFKDLTQKPPYLKIILSLPGMMTFEPKKSQIIVFIITFAIVIIISLLAVLKLIDFI